MNRKTFTHLNKNQYLPTIEQINEDSGRMYDIQGVRYPSITTMLSHFAKTDIMNWRDRIGADEANKISRKAAVRGTKFHKICENYMTHEDMEFETPLLQHMFINTKKYLDCIDNVHIIESRLYSHHLRLAGTVDCIAEYNGRLSVIDFKTSLKPKRKDWVSSYFIQASAYCIMYEELLKIPVSDVVIIVGVEGSETQVFHEKRDNFTKELLRKRNEYERFYLQRHSSSTVN